MVEYAFIVFYELTVVENFGIQKFITPFEF